MAKETINIRILKSLIESPKTNAEILKDLKLRTYNQIGKQLNDLKTAGYVVQDSIDSKRIDPKKRGPRTNTYNMVKSDISTLAFLINSVYTTETLPRLMNSSYYQSMIPDVIDYFDQELVKQDYKLTSREIADLKDYLKCSESCLTFILDPNMYKSKFTMYQRLSEYEKADTIFILDTLTAFAVDSQYNKSRRLSKPMIEKEKASIKKQYDDVYNKFTLPTFITGLFNHLVKTDLLKCHEGTDTANDIEKLLQKSMKKYARLNKNAYADIYNNGV